MQSVELDEFGGPSVLKVRQSEIPHVDAKSLLIKIHMTSVNPLDCEIRQGYLKQFTGDFPLRLGMDVAGEVISVGRQIKHFRVNDRVFAKSIYLLAVPMRNTFFYLKGCAPIFLLQLIMIKLLVYHMQV